MKIIAASIALIFISGCAAYRPIPTQSEHVPFRDYVAKAASSEDETSNTLRQVDTALSKYINVTLSSLQARSSASWDISDGTAVGAIGAVVGGIAHRTGLLNTGLFVAGTGATTLTRYKMDHQVDLYILTVNKLTCVKGRVAAITPSIERLVRSSQDPSAIDALESSPRKVIDTVEAIQYAHLTALYSQKASVPTRDELTDYFNRYALARSSAESSGTSARASNKSDAVIAAVKTILAFDVDVESCARLQ